MSFVSTSSVISHPEHILLPEYGQEITDMDAIETLMSQQTGDDNIQVFQQDQNHGNIETLIAQQSDDEIETLLSRNDDDQMLHEEGSPCFLPRIESESSFLIPEAEVREDDKRIEECKESLERQRRYHEVWEADIEKRKRELKERVEKLNLFHKNRLMLYDDFKSYAFDMKRKLRNKTDKDKVRVKKADKTNT